MIFFKFWLKSSISAKDGHEKLSEQYAFLWEMLGLSFTFFLIVYGFEEYILNYIVVEIMLKKSSSEILILWLSNMCSYYQIWVTQAEMNAENWHWNTPKWFSEDVFCWYHVLQKP